jgi:hypothetical protein
MQNQHEYCEKPQFMLPLVGLHLVDHSMSGFLRTPESAASHFRRIDPLPVTRLPGLGHHPSGPSLSQISQSEVVFLLKMKVFRGN